MNQPKAARHKIQNTKMQWQAAGECGSNNKMFKIRFRNYISMCIYVNSIPKRLKQAKDTERERETVRMVKNDVKRVGRMAKRIHYASDSIVILPTAPRLKLTLRSHKNFTVGTIKNQHDMAKIYWLFTIVLNRINWTSICSYLSVGQSIIKSTTSYVY